MTIRKAKRQEARIRLALQGASGTGKTYSALQIASGMTSWDKICIIDTENNSADLYAHLGDFNVYPLKQPFTPERYIQALDDCEKAGMEVIIIDSMSHEWDGSGGILEYHASLAGNSFTNWSKITPRHNAMIQRIMRSNAHIIATMRTRQDYVLSDKNGKMVPEKVGLKSIARDGTDYEFTLVFDIDITHKCVASKDRTGMFADQPAFKPDAQTGKRIHEWCNEGEKVDLPYLIAACKNNEELKTLYSQCSQDQRVSYQSLFNQKHKDLTQHVQSNGTYPH